MDKSEAQAHAERVFGPKPIMRGSTGGDPLSRFFVAPAGYLADQADDRLPPWHVGIGASWEGAFDNYNAALVRDGLVPLATALARYQFTSHDEHRLYPLMEQVLRDAGFDFVREYKLDEKSRLDFWFPSLRVALEVKVRGQRHAVLRQIRRYAEYPMVGGVLLASTVAKLLSVPEILAFKPARAVRLAGAFG